MAVAFGQKRVRMPKMTELARYQIFFMSDLQIKKDAY